MALQEAAVFQDDVVRFSLDAEIEEAYYLAGRQAEFFLLRNDKRDPLWFMADTESTLCREDEDLAYAIMRDHSMSFPTPKLGAKTRPC